MTVFWVVLAIQLAVSQSAPTIPPSVNIRSYGAKGDGVADDSSAMQAAIDACPAGGVVLVPKGRWLIRHDALRLRSEIMLRGMGKASVIVKGRPLSVAVEATDISHAAIQKLSLVVESTTPAVMEGDLIHFHHCRNVTLSGCVLDGTAMNGAPSQFSLCQFQCCNDVKCLDNHFMNAEGSATGVTGASAEPSWGLRSEFARNVIDGYCDTGIGLWTGASGASIHDNWFRGGLDKHASYPVGIDVDGGTRSLIENNDIAGGHIAIRLYDTHDGVYPIEALVIRGNNIHDQRTYDATHPAWAIKPENPKSRVEATISKNRIVETAPNALIFAGGGAGDTTLHVDDNEVSGGPLWGFGWYKEGALQLFSGGKKVDWRTTSGSNTSPKGAPH